MPAVLSSLLSTFTEVTYGNRRDQRQGSQYFNRPRYLIAPTSSDLAQPWRFLDRSADGRDLSNPNSRRIVYSSPMSTTLSQKVRKMPSQNTYYYPPSQRRENIRNRDATDMYNPSTHIIPRNHVSFPPPPSLNDILRMEPDLSPRSAVMRAGDVTDSSLLSRELIEMYGYCLAEPRESPDSSPIATWRSPSPLYPPSNFANTKLNLSAFADGYSGGAGSMSNYSSHEDLSSDLVYLAARTKTMAFACWASDYLYAFATQGEIDDSSFDATSTKRHAANHISQIIFEAELSPSAVFLAVWYITLIPLDLVHHVQYTQRSRYHCEFREWNNAEETMMSAFVVGSLLATKWLDDFTMTTKHWRMVSGLPLELINRLEASALSQLKYRLGIDPRAWHGWLSVIKDNHIAMVHDRQPIDAHHVLVGEAIDEKLADIQAQATNTTIPFFSDQSSPHYDHAMCEFQANDLTYPDPDQLDDSPVFVDQPYSNGCRTPASWYPEADPIVPKAPRQIGNAPGASNFAESIVNNILGLGGYVTDIWGTG